MKLIGTFIISLLAYATAIGMQVELNSYNFYSQSSYTEIYIRIEGNSIKWVDAGIKQTSAVSILLMVTKSDGSIAAYDKYSLKGETKDSLKIDFLELKRYPLAPGSYTIRLETFDENNLTDKLEIEQSLIVENKGLQVQISDLLPLSIIRKDTTSSHFVRNGYYMEPLSYHYSDKSQKQIDLYLEAYRQDLNMDYVLQYSIMEGSTQNLTPKAIMTKYKLLQKMPFIAEVISLPVNSLRSGNYHILVNVIDKNKNVLASRTTNFARSNPEADMDYLEHQNDQLENSFVQSISAESMDYVLKALLPITPQHQVSTLGELLHSDRIKSQRQFIYQLWKLKSPEHPDQAYKSYMEVASAVDKKFYSNVGYGFQSDRGHIFLKYGKPTNVLSIDSEVDAPPYEIWYYNNMPLTNQTNVRFIFYNPSLSHNDFKLLHSTCIGEKVNPAWEVELYKSVPLERLGNSTDATQVKDNWNRNARRYFNEY